jgi:hypothetical protein
VIVASLNIFVVEQHVEPQPNGGSADAAWTLATAIVIFAAEPTARVQRGAAAACIGSIVQGEAANDRHSEYMVPPTISLLSRQWAVSVTWPATAKS